MFEKNKENDFNAIQNLVEKIKKLDLSFIVQHYDPFFNESNSVLYLKFQYCEVF